MIEFLSFSRVLIAAVLLLVIFLFRKNKKDPRYPPGPTSIPFLGNILQLRNNPMQVLQTWAGKYGHIYSIRLGNQDTVVINDPKLVKELFNNANSTGRDSNPMTYYFGRGHGIVNCNGQAWQDQRAFTSRKLRDFGVLKSSNVGFLMEDVKALINFFERRAGTPLKGQIKLFNGPIINSLWRTLSGESTNWDSVDKPEIVKKAERLFESANSATIIVFAPFLRHLAPKYFGWTAWTTSVDSFSELMGKAVKKHSKELDVDNPKDFIDVYLLKIREATDPTSSFYQNNGENHLKAVLFDVFAGGSETTSATLSFATLYLLLNKEAQRNAQKELDRVVGSSRQVSLSDRPELPYNKAIVLEVLRLSSVAPLGMPHRMTADTMFHGYLLPKDVTVFANFHAINHDPNIWGKDANEFRPERFLNEDKTEVILNEALTPFSVGRRVCIGEGLAKDMLFTFIASILQNFNIEPDPECPVLKAETVSGILAEPKLFKFVLTSRNKNRCDVE